MSDNPSFHNASLLSALSFISSRPDHYYPSPKFQPKRASVALIIWIKPHQTHSPSSTSSQGIFGLMLQSSIGLVKTLSELFSQSWVQQGEPQVLFIKRAKRTGDRWSAHVALPGISWYLEILTQPGGKRDPGDADDRVTAERETREEIGLTLTSNNSIYCGGLDQRLVSTSGTTVPLMVLCPYGMNLQYRL